MAGKEWGLTTRTRKRIGGAPFTLSAIYKILKNPFYAGIIEWEGASHPGFEMERMGGLTAEDEALTLKQKQVLEQKASALDSQLGNLRFVKLPGTAASRANEASPQTDEQC
jgi:hypothetical protein